MLTNLSERPLPNGPQQIEVEEVRLSVKVDDLKDSPPSNDEHTRPKA
jgi:hypothetical protein